MTKLIIVMIGLPARGKSYISHKLNRYFIWSGFKSKIFNVGKQRRIDIKQCDSSFFKPENADIRNNIANKVLLELIKWLLEVDNKIAIFDATNSNINRRKEIINTIETFKIDKLKVCFVETECDLPDIINKNISMKAYTMDYIDKGMDYTITDFNQRMLYYMDNYQTFTISEIEQFSNYSYIRIKNINSLFTIYNVCGFLLSNVISYLLNLNIKRNKIFLTRHGESEYNLYNKVGGNPSLSKFGQQYSTKLFNYIQPLLENVSHYKICTSTLRRTHETIIPFKNKTNKNYEILEYKCLDEIDAGIYNSLTYDEIKQHYPEEYQQRKLDKFNYRYPRGESYYDVIQRVNKFIYDIENNTEPILIVAHQAIIRVIYSYLMNIDNIEMTGLEIPLHTIMELEPFSYEYKVNKKLLLSKENHSSAIH